MSEGMGMSEIDETTDDFRALLGAFGSNASGDKRAKAERLAALKPGDGRRRRGPRRDCQFNVRITEAAKARADWLADTLDCSLADVIEKALELMEAQRTKS